MARSENGTLSFKEAMAMANAGRKIKRVTWLAYLVLNQAGVLQFQKTEGNLSKSYTPTGIDLSQRDWEYA